MTVTKIAISLDEELADAVKAAAEAEGCSVSGWLAEAAMRRVRNAQLGKLLAGYADEHGAFTEDELAESKGELGL